MDMPIDKLIAPLKEFAINRYPLKLVIGSTGCERPMVSLTVWNQTATLAVFVHAIRVHYGNKWFSRALTLTPFTTVSLAPKAKAEWVLSYDDTILTERTIQKEPPTAQAPDKQQPGIESPAQLFNAIGMGDKKDSWIEIDFNEYEQREFLRGKVKGAFDMVGNLHRQIRKRKEAEQAGAGQPATRSESDSEGSDKPQPESEGRSR